MFLSSEWLRAQSCIQQQHKQLEASLTLLPGEERKEGPVIQGMERIPMSAFLLLSSPCSTLRMALVLGNYLYHGSMSS